MEISFPNFDIHPHSIAQHDEEEYLKMHNGDNHSGYTEAQYQSLVWLVAKTDVQLERITTHKIVDRSGSRIDPRSFNFNLFQKLLSEYSRVKEIHIGCP